MVSRDERDNSVYTALVFLKEDWNRRNEKRERETGEEGLSE